MLSECFFGCSICVYIVLVRYPDGANYHQFSVHYFFQCISGESFSSTLHSCFFFLVHVVQSTFTHVIPLSRQHLSRGHYTLHVPHQVILGRKRHCLLRYLFRGYIKLTNSSKKINCSQGRYAFNKQVQQKSAFEVEHRSNERKLQLTEI